MRLELKKLTVNELEMLLKWRISPEIDRMMFTHVHLDMEEQMKWFEMVSNSSEEIRWIIWADDKPVGSMYLIDIDRNNSRCESGWFVAEKGVLDLKSIISLQRNMYDYVFDSLGLNRIYGYVIDDNKNAVKLLEMCGIVCEGLLSQHIRKDDVFHDVYVVGLTKEQWSEKKNNLNYKRISIE